MACLRREFLPNGNREPISRRGFALQPRYSDSGTFDVLKQNWRLPLGWPSLVVEYGVSHAADRKLDPAARAMGRLHQAGHGGPNLEFSCGNAVEDDDTSPTTPAATSTTVNWTLLSMMPAPMA